MKLFHIWYSDFQTAGFALGPGVHESKHDPFKCRFSASYITLGFSDTSSVDFQSPPFWGLIVSSIQVSRAGVPDVEHEVLAHQGETLYL